MNMTDKVLTVGDLRKKIEKMDDAIELEVLITSDEYPYIPHYPISDASISYKVKDTESMERIGPERLTLFPITGRHILANPDSYSPEIKDRIAAITTHTCRIK